MRLTDDRYAREREQFELALRMIGHEARTRTIKACTGLSDDRIRKLYATYFRDSGRTDIKRRRGKSPQQVTRFVKNPEHQLQATTLLGLFIVGLLLRVDADRRVHAAWPRPGVEFGHRLCRAFETYSVLFERPLLSFEWAWNLMNTVAYNDELQVSTCRLCDAPYVQDAFAIDPRRCPACVLSRETPHNRPS
jgi:hypothetical protein